MSSYLRRLSLRFLLDELLHHNRENGPGEIRTRICNFDRVLCSPYTTGPERAWSAPPEMARAQLTFGSARAELGQAMRRVKGPPCRTERGDKDGATARFLHVSVLRSIHFWHNQNHTSKPQPGLPLPAARLEHVGFVQPSDGQTLHGADEILADFK
jgi:hypothetical protein